MSILVVNGPNLDRLGRRQPDIYGSTTLQDIEDGLTARAGELGVEVEFFRSNSEGEIIDRIHRAADDGDAVIINAGGLTHTSVALKDALAEITDGAGYVEVHISNIHAREEFRHHSYLSAGAAGVIVGLGAYGYTAALEFLARR